MVRRVLGIRRLCAALVVLVCVVYASTLDNGFHFDDHHSIERNVAIRSLAAVPSYFVDGGTFSVDPDVSMYRPLLLVSYALNYLLGGNHAAGYHAVNVALHASFVVLVFLLGLRLTGRRMPMWWAAAILAVHPLNSQAVNYVSSRSGVLAAIGALGAFYLSSLATRPRPVMAGMSQLAGLLAKSTAFAGVGLTAVYEYGRRGPRRISCLVALAVASVAYVVGAWASGFYGMALHDVIRPLPTQALTQFKALAYYLYLWASPVHLSISHPFIESAAPTAAVVTGGLLMLSLVAIGLIAWRRRQLAGFAVLWFYGGLALTSAMPLYIIVSEHRLYLSMAGLAVLGAHLWHPPRWLPPLTLPGALLLGLAALTIQRNGVWQDELTLWSDAARIAPGDYRVWSGVGEAHHRKGSLDSAAVAYERALDLRPDNEVLWNNIGLLHNQRGQLPLAEAAFRQALKLRPEWPEAQANLGRFLLSAGRSAEAAPLLGRAAARSSSVGVLVNLGVAAGQDGRLDVAAEAFDAALRLEPKNYEAMANLAAVRIEQALATQVVEEREQFLHESLRLSQAAIDAEPASQWRARMNLASAYAAQGQNRAARESYLDLLRLEPELATVYKAYGRLLVRMGDPGAADVLRRGIELGASTVRIWQDLGAAEAARGRWAAAEAAFVAAVELAPQDAASRYNLAEIIFRRWQEALAAGGTGSAAVQQDAVAAYRAVEALQADYRSVRQRLRQLADTAP